MEAAQTHHRQSPNGARPTDPYAVHRREAFYRFAAAGFVVSGRRRVLDLGCGDGFGSAILASARLDVTGVDRDDVAVRAAFDRWGSSVTFRHSPLPRTDEPQRSFDAVVCAGLLEREQDPVRLLHETLRLLKPGGLLVLRTPNRLTNSPGRTRPVAGGHVWEYTPDELFHLLRRRFVSVRMDGVWHGRRLRMVEAAVGGRLPVVLDGVPAADRAPWLRMALARLGSRSFVVGQGSLRSALDLIASGTA